VEDAQDLTQEFFARILDRHLFGKADRSKGRFRTFLLSSMEHFLANEWDHARALKRGSGKHPVPLQIGDAETRYGVEPADTRSPEHIFEYNWAVALLDQVILKLESEYVERGQSEHWLALKPCIVTGLKSESCTERAESLGLSEGAYRVAVHRLRSRYRELLRAEIASTVDTSSEVDAEMRHLFKVLAGK
jgi:RNA polymerase sigma-70 factor (ECF subfamily)